MIKPTRNIICLDQISFDGLMDDRGWNDYLPHNIAAVSICSPNEEYEHWFKTDCNNKKKEDVYHTSIFNLDIDDCGPFWFLNHEGDCYDKALELFKKGDIKQSNAYFSYVHISGPDNKFYTMIHVMDYEEAFALVEWIERRIREDETFYIHCAAGVSRSQGVVRYILDTYGNDYDIKTNPHNPCITPNVHVVMMLKRAYREIFNNVEEDYFDTKLFDVDEFEKRCGDIKINLF